MHRLFLLRFEAQADLCFTQRLRNLLVLLQALRQRQVPVDVAVIAVERLFVIADGGGSVARLDAQACEGRAAVGVELAAAVFLSEQRSRLRACVRPQLW